MAITFLPHLSNKEPPVVFSQSVMKTSYCDTKHAYIFPLLIHFKGWANGQFKLTQKVTIKLLIYKLYLNLLHLFIYLWPLSEIHLLHRFYR